MISTQVEKFADCIAELAPLFEVHWNELGLFKDRMPLAPQYDEYVRREEAGILFLVTARIEGKIVGYIIIQVWPGLHYGTTLTALTDIAYITPQHRDRGYALPLFKRAQSELKRRGAQIWYAGHKTYNTLGMDRFLEAYGFLPADTILIKWIG